MLLTLVEHCPTEPVVPALSARHVGASVEPQNIIQSAVVKRKVVERSAMDYAV